MNQLHRAFSKLAFVCVLFIAFSCSKDDDPTTPTPDLKAPAAPVAAAATSVIKTGFSASWNAVEGAKSYAIDVSSDDFATFVTGYNGKSVSTTSEAVSGLTAGTTYKYRVRAVNDVGASANSNAVTVTTVADEEPVKETVVGKVDGTDFKATTVALTNTGRGLELSFKDATDDFSFRLSDVIEGTYSVENIYPSARTQEPAQLAIAFWTKGGKDFYGTTGSITVAIVGDKVNVTFSLSGKSDDGTTSEITDGKIDDLTIGEVVSDQCLLTAFDEEHPENDDTSFAYDGQGRLIEIVQSNQHWTFFWSGSKVTKSIYSNGEDTNVETWTYTGDNLTQITGEQSSVFDLQTDNYKVEFEYTGGKLTKSTRNESLGEVVKNTYVNEYTYTGDNVTLTERTRTRDDKTDNITLVYSDYDTKNNYWALLGSAVGNPFPEGFESELDAAFVSKNNAGKIVYSVNGKEISTITYTYNAYTTAGYPTEIDYTYSETGLNASSSVTMNYDNCND